MTLPYGNVSPSLIFQHYKFNTIHTELCVGATHPLVSATGFCILRIVDNTIHQKWIFPPHNASALHPVPPTTKYIPFTELCHISYPQTSASNPRGIHVIITHRKQHIHTIYIKYICHIYINTYMTYFNLSYRKRDKLKIHGHINILSIQKPVAEASAC